MNRNRTILDRYRASLSNTPSLAAEEELDLARRWRTGDPDAGHRLIEASLRFVVSVALEYRRWGAPVEDLVQQGNVGLLKAAAKFDPAKGCRLITYAGYWVRAEIRDYVVRNYRVVRLGTTRTERTAMRSFRRHGSDNPTELAEASGMPRARAEKLLPLLQHRDISLDASNDEQPPRVTGLPTDIETPESTTLRRDTVLNVRQVLDNTLPTLSDRERRIVEARLMSEDPMTLAELGSEMGVSKERVRQLEARVCAKLRALLEEFRPAA